MAFNREEAQTKIENTYSTPTAPVASSIIRYDLLSMSTKGVFPDVIPDRETLEEIVKEIGKSELCVPLKPADPSFTFTRDSLWWRNLYEKDPTRLERKLDNQEWEKRRKALLYASLIANTDYDRMKFLVETGESLSLAQQMLAQELEEAKERGKNIPEKKLFQ
jgi:hypothetical protein